MAILIPTLLLLLSFYPVIAAEYTMQTYEINWQPYSDDYDKAINRAGVDEINPNTWQPRPTGIYAGSYIPESELSLNQIMYYWYEWYEKINGSIIDQKIQYIYGGKVILAQFIKYDATVIMSGASMLYVRLPINASSFEKGVFYIYHVDDINVNWSVENIKNYNTANATLLQKTYRKDEYLNGRWVQTFRDGRYNFHVDGDLIAAVWFDTDNSNISDIYPYVRNYRVYIPIKVPIKPDEYYVFVTVAYAKSTIPNGTTNIFITPDSISSLSSIRSFIGWATDASTYDIIHDEYEINVSLGYSIVFNQGYGDSISAKTYLFSKGDEIHFTVDTREINESNKYVTVMFPFISNDTVNVTISIVDPYGGEQTKENIEGRDFILTSFDNLVNDTYVYLIKIRFNKDARIGLILVEPSNYSWYVNTEWEEWTNKTGDWEGWSYTQLHSTFLIKTANGKIKNIFFSLYAPVQFGNGKWNYTIPSEATKYKHSWWHEFANKFFCGVCGLFIIAAGLNPIGMKLSAIFSDEHNPYELAIAGIQIALYQNWSKFFEFAISGATKVKIAFDVTANVINQIGEFVKKVVYYIKTAVNWVLEKIQYYGSIILEVGAQIIYILGFVGVIYLWGWFLNTMMWLLLGDIEQFKKSAAEPIGIIRSIRRRK